jgi:hypothetical protein
MTAPVSAHAPVTTGSCPRTKAAATHPQLAPPMTLSEPEASVRTPMNLVPSRCRGLGGRVKSLNTIDLVRFGV